MSIRSFARGVVAASLVALGGLSATAGVFVQPTPAELSGTTASGVAWTAVATGTFMPVTGTSAAAGSPGAVVYFNTQTGQIQIDPKGLKLSTAIITYGTGTDNHHLGGWHTGKTSQKLALTNMGIIQVFRRNQYAGRSGNFTHSANDGQGA